MGGCWLAGELKRSVCLSQRHAHRCIVLFIRQRSGADSTVKVWDVAQRSCVSTTNVGAQTWAVDWQPLQANQSRVGKDFVLGGDDNRVTWMKAAGSS